MAHTTRTTNFAGMTMTSDTPKGMATGSITGLTAGAVVSFVALARRHQFCIQRVRRLKWLTMRRVCRRNRKIRHLRGKKPFAKNGGGSPNHSETATSG